MLSIKHLEVIPLNVPFYHERVSPTHAPCLDTRGTGSRLPGRTQ